MAANILSTKGSHTVKYTTPSGGVTAGALLIVGATPMIPLETTTATGVVVECQVGGAVRLSKETGVGTDLAVGGRVYYMTADSVNKATGIAAVAKVIGYAIEAAATSATTAKVQLIAGPMINEAAT